MQKTVGIFLSVTWFVTVLMGQLSPNATTKHDHALAAQADQGDLFVTAREMLVDISDPRWHSGKGALAILFDSSSGYYQWRLAPVAKNTQSADLTDGYGTLSRIHVSADRLVYFAFGYPNLAVKESRTKASNLDDAEAKALQEAKTRLPAVLAHKMDDWVLTNLGKVLPYLFFVPMGSSAISGPIKIIEIAHKANTWELVLQGQWQEKIVLDDKYQVTATTRIN